MKPSDNPYKPGTSEFNDWNKDVFMRYQRTPAVFMPAMQEADRRLAALKEKYIKPVLLDPDVYLLVHGQEFPEVEEEPVDLAPAYKSRILDINATWAKTEQYVIINSMLAYMPQIDATPDWVTDKQLYSILIKASGKDVEEIKQQHEYIFYAVMKPAYWQSMAGISSQQATVDQVRVKFERWMR